MFEFDCSMNEAVILDGDVLVIRGKESCIQEDYTALKRSMLERGHSINDMGVYSWKDYGISVEDGAHAIAYMLEHTSSGTCNKLRTLLNEGNSQKIQDYIDYLKKEL